MDVISSSTFTLNKNIDHTRSLLSLSNYEEKTFKALKPQLLAVLIATLNHIVIGISLTYSAILLPQLNADEHFKDITDSQKSWIASTYVLTVPFGSIMTGYIMDRIGRLNTLKLTTLPHLLGWILLATAQSFPMLIIGRILMGLASAFGTNPVQVYVAEISHKDLRGSFLSLGPGFMSIGIIITYLQGWLFGWRLLAWLAALYSIIPMILLFLIKESPLWLIAKNRIEDARISLNWFYRYQTKLPNSDQNFAEVQLQLLQKDNNNDKIDDETVKTSNWRAFLKPTAYKPLLILIGIFVFQQFSGIYIFLFYTITFFESVGSTINPYAASIGIGIIRLIMSMITLWMFKKYGRRSLLMLSGISMAIFITISGIFTYLVKTEQTDLNWVPVVGLLLYVVSSMVGFLPIPWMVPAELLPLEIRSIALSIVIAVANATMFVAVQSFYFLVNLFNGTAGVQWFFGAVSLLGALYTFVFLPETHQKKLSEIEDYFNEHTIYFIRKS